MALSVDSPAGIGSSMNGTITATCSATDSTAAVHFTRLIRSPVSSARISAQVSMTGSA